MRSRRTLALALSVLAIVTLVMPVSAAKSEPAQSYIVVLRDSVVSRPGGTAKRPRIDAQRVSELVRTISRRTGVAPANTFTSVFGGFSARLGAGQLHSVESDPAVASVTLDSAVHLQGERVGPWLTETQVSLSSPKVPAGIRRVGATSNGIAAIGGDGGKVGADVAVIDTGIQRDHPDLNVAGGYNCTSSNRARWDDGNGHGTHVAGIIGALDNGQGVVGVAPGVRLWALKVLDDTGNGLLSWIVCGIDWITAQRSGDGSRPLIDVANMSLRTYLTQGDDHNCGRTRRDAMHSAICRSVAAGTVYVVAAGNDRDDAARYRPGAYDEAITVSAITDYDGKSGGEGTRPADCPAGYPDDTFAGFSNFGADVDLTAPGVCVLSTWNGDRYAYASGTSMAAPHVAGAAALYLAQFPGAQPQQVKMALQHVGQTDWKRSTDPDGRPDLLLWTTDFDRPPDFTISASSPASYAGPDVALAVPVTLTRFRGYSARVTFSMAGLPRGVTAVPVTTGNDKATLEVSASSTASNGRFTITVVADDGELRHTTDVTIRVDANPPTAPTSVTPGAGFWYSPDGEVTLRWSGATDTGSGVSSNAVVRRRMAPTNSGTCGDFANDGDARMLVNGYADDGLLSGYCYRWQVSSVDRVGNVSSAVTSGKVLVDRVAPKVLIDKPAPGSTTVKSRSSQVVRWSASDSGGSRMASVTVQRQRATSHRTGSCAAATWKLDGSARKLTSPITETGLAPGSCYRWLITARDKATNYTTATSGAVLISSSTTTSTQTTGPSVRDLTLAPTSHARMPSADMVWLDARWSASAGSGSIVGYELRLSSSGGAAWSTMTTPNGSTPFMALRLPAGRTYLVEVRARNSAGAWSDWSAPRTVGLKLAQGEGSGFEKVGSWKSASLAGASGGAVTYSTSSGAVIRYSFSGRSVALVSTLGPGRGLADVYVDGYRATTIDLSSSTLTTRQVVFTRTWSTSGAHVISLQLRSSARVDVDGVVVLN